MSEDVERRLVQVLDNPTTSPFGNPIPGLSELGVTSAGEKRMLAKARQILVSELALAEKTNEDKAEAILDEVLAS